MKFHYIHILFFLSLNILLLSSEVYNQRNHYITRTPKATTRTLCECELYAPSNYDNDPEMKAVMQGFDRQTSQRFKEYDERMIKNRQKCREQCDKEIQKIILKDKIEKELTGKLSTLQTDIQSDAIPTCVCEKSIADKVEKGCLKCAGVLGGGVTPAWGFLSGIVYTGWKAAALAAAKELAEKSGAAKGLAAGTKAGIDAVMDGLLTDLGVSNIVVTEMGLVINATSYTDVPMITEAVYAKFKVSCLPPVPVSGASPGPFSIPATDKTFCFAMSQKLSTQRTYLYTGDSTKAFIKEHVASIVSQAETTAGATTEAVTEEAIATLTAQKTGVVQTTYMGYQTPIIASIVAILVIVLVMVIIYLILRYRRKKKMKKKLQYIKLLEE